MTVWDKRVRSAFIALLVIFPWVWLLLPPVCLAILSCSFAIPALYALHRMIENNKREKEEYEERQRQRVKERMERMEREEREAAAAERRGQYLQQMSGW